MAVREEMNLAGVKVRVLLSSRDTRGRYAICQVDASSTSLFSNGSLPVHTHSYEDGFFYILEGGFQFQVGGQTIDALPGTSVFIPRQTPYTVCNRASGPGRFLIVAHPGGIDLFFHDLSLLFQAADVPVNGDKLTSVLDKHGISLSGESNHDNGL